MKLCGYFDANNLNIALVEVHFFFLKKFFNNKNTQLNNADIFTRNSLMPSVLLSYMQVNV